MMRLHNIGIYTVSTPNTTPAEKTIGATTAAVVLNCSRQWFYKLRDQYGLKPDPTVEGTQFLLKDIERIKKLEQAAGRLGGK